MSQDLQQARYDQLVRRVGALYGGGSKVTEVLAELFPVLEVEDTTPELLALTGWRTAWQSTERPASVAENSVSQLFNPAGSNQLVAVTQIIIRSSVDTFLNVEIQATQIGTPVSGLFRDSRFGVPRSTTAQVSSIDLGVVGGGLRLIVTNNEETTYRDDNGIVVLAPGSGLTIGTTAANTILVVNYFWRERLAQASELLFP